MVGMLETGLHSPFRGRKFLGRFRDAVDEGVEDPNEPSEEDEELGLDPEPKTDKPVEEDEIELVEELKSRGFLVVAASFWDSGSLW
jgi:hypothetical protein